MVTPTDLYLQNLYALRLQSKLRLEALRNRHNVNGKYHEMFTGMRCIESEVLEGLQNEINRVSCGGRING